MTERVEMVVLFPYHKGESAGAWTNRVLKKAAEHGTYRQCTIGWHGECSMRGEGERATCLCICHAKKAKIWTVVGWKDGAEAFVAGVIKGERHVSGGDVEKVWAEWVYARDADEAEKAGLLKASGGLS